MEIDTKPVFKLPPDDVLLIDIQRCLLHKGYRST